MDLDIKCTVTLSKEEVLEIIGNHIDEKFPRYRDPHPHGEPLDFVQGGGGLIVTYGKRPQPEDTPLEVVAVQVAEEPAVKISAPANTQPANA